ncbi:MAG: Uma2 family endonuclease, partial [Planctomycetes bacterium]|nr:Uma2 family endonuclease [Planctomycetota bacterium]
MTVAKAQLLDFSEPPPVPIRRFTVVEYHRLGEVGVLTEDDRVELLEGWILEKMVHNPPHGATIDQARDTIGGRLPPEWRVRVQLPITTADSEPEPDLAVVRGPASRYARNHPGPEEVAFLVEVADTTLVRDRGFKGRIYA